MVVSKVTRLKDVWELGKLAAISGYHEVPTAIWVIGTSLLQYAIFILQNETINVSLGV